MELSMASNEKLNQALRKIHKLVESKGKVHVLQTREMSRSDREILFKNRWLQEIIRGWYLLVRPDIRSGESSAWYASFWDFIKVYLEFHYNDKYCLSAEQSLDLHIGETTIPKQVIIMVEKGNGIPVKLPFDTSLIVYSSKEYKSEERVKINDLFVMDLPYALCKASPSYYMLHEQDAELALLSIREPSELIHTIIKNNFVRAAGRIVGAYSFLGKKEIADTIRNAITEAGIVIQEQNPFKREIPFLSGINAKSPYQARIEIMWSQYRNKIISLFPNPPGLPTDSKTYLKNVEEIHTQDAYHSLSIEGYKVSIKLIQKVESGDWNPDLFHKDSLYRNALAARGYYESFLEVEKSIAQVIKGSLPGIIAKTDLPVWFRKLFSPLVEAKIHKQEDLWGYRRHQVYIRNSRHTPLSKDHLLDAMDTFYNCLVNEENAAVRAVLGHFIFVYIHPYMDGNGRTGRFLMNVMLASGGYPWTVIKVENRKQYFQALESASVDHDIEPFAKFIASELKSSS